MPLGSASAAPVTNPGPRTWNSFRSAGSVVSIEYRVLHRLLEALSVAHYGGRVRQKGAQAEGAARSAQRAASTRHNLGSSFFRIARSGRQRVAIIVHALLEIPCERLALLIGKFKLHGEYILPSPSCNLPPDWGVLLSGLRGKREPGALPIDHVVPRQRHGFQPLRKLHLEHH